MFLFGRMSAKDAESIARSFAGMRPLPVLMFSWLGASAVWALASGYYIYSAIVFAVWLPKYWIYAWALDRAGRVPLTLTIGLTFVALLGTWFMAGVSI